MSWSLGAGVLVSVFGASVLVLRVDVLVFAG